MFHGALGRGGIDRRPQLHELMVSPTQLDAIVRVGDLVGRMNTAEGCHLFLGSIGG
jgi:hypothetical protein